MVHIWDSPVVLRFKRFSIHSCMKCHRLRESNLTLCLVFNFSCSCAKLRGNRTHVTHTHMHVDKHLQCLFTVGHTCSYVQDQSVLPLFLSYYSSYRYTSAVFSQLNTHTFTESCLLVLVWK